MKEIDLDILNEAIALLKNFPKDFQVWKEQSKIIKETLKRIKPYVEEKTK